MRDSSDPWSPDPPATSGEASDAGHGRSDDLRSELRRLGRAALFFLGCLAVFAALLAIGLYH